MANCYSQLRNCFLLILSSFFYFFTLSSALEGSSIVDPQVLVGQIVTPGPDVYANWTGWEEWTPSPDVTKAFTIYRMGYDNDGLLGRCFYS